MRWKGLSLSNHTPIPIPRSKCKTEGDVCHSPSPFQMQRGDGSTLLVFFDATRRSIPPCRVEFLFFDLMRRCTPPRCVEFRLFFSFQRDVEVQTPLLLETSGGGFFCTLSTPRFKQWWCLCPPLSYCHSKPTVEGLLHPPPLKNKLNWTSLNRIFDIIFNFIKYI